MSKNIDVRVRMDEEEKKMLITLANDTGMNNSQFIRFLIRNEYKQKNEERK